MHKGKGKGKNLQDPDILEAMQLLQYCRAAPDSNWQEGMYSQSSNWQEGAPAPDQPAYGSEYTHIYLPQGPNPMAVNPLSSTPMDHLTPDILCVEQPEKRARTEPEAPPEAPTEAPHGGIPQDGNMGRWVLNPGWTVDHIPCLEGWIFVQGWWQWGVCLSWHVQRLHQKHNDGQLRWDSWVWYNNDGRWRAYMEQSHMIPDALRDNYPHWMIHENGECRPKKKVINIFIIAPPEEPAPLKEPCLFFVFS